MKHIVVSFSLMFPEHNKHQAAYRALGALGLIGFQNGVVLPSNTVMGIWWTDVPTEEIRSTVMYSLNQAGANPSAVFVARCEEAAWWGQPIKQQ